MAQVKYYVVWKGVNPGIYNNWNECKKQVIGEKGTKYKAFDTLEDAEIAFRKGYESYLSSVASADALRKLTAAGADAGTPINKSICVDAACSGNPGDMEYRGVETATGKEIFHLGPLKKGTNNIGEFLAIVHGLALMKQKNCDIPIYSDSRNAIGWIKKKKCKTLLEPVKENKIIFELIERAEKWLAENEYPNRIIKWETNKWGEIPADFGRK